MDPTPLTTIARWTQATLSQGEGRVTRVATDTRTLAAGDLFVALSGENFDGHRFLSQAAQAGAIGAIIAADYAGEVPPPPFALLRVSDPLEALQRLAACYRATLPLKVIGITGSSGKTSTKDFTAAVLGQRYRVTFTQGNLNNHIGLPLSVLAAESADQVGIFEMGMNHPGEIAPLAAIARPDLAIITNIGVAHLEFMKTREAIAAEKGELAAALGPQGVLLMPAGDDYGDFIARRIPGRTLFSAVGDDPRASLSATVTQTGFEGTHFTVSERGGSEVAAFLPVAGLHMVENALLALAAGLALGVPLEEGVAGLASSTLTKGRLQKRQRGGFSFLDDSYNANPDSMRAALETLASLPTPGRRIAVLGRMGELGGAAESGHRSVGAAAAKAGIEALIAVGEEARWIAEEAKVHGIATVWEVADPGEAAELLARHATPEDLILIKASRSVRMERVLEHPAFT